MERKTKVHAEEGRQEILITRDFELPVDLLFKAYEDRDIVEQWMSNTVLKLENKKHGGYQFQKKDDQGNIVFSANGTIHDFIPNHRIIRTFEMENAPFGVQLEFLDFESIDKDNSRLTMHIVFKSVESRDQLLKMPFAMGINMAHNRIHQIMQSTQS